MQPILETNTSKYIILEEIGHGATCSVYKGYSLEDTSKKLYAIKIFDEKGKKYYDKELLINKYLPPHYFVHIYNFGDGFIRKENINTGNIYHQKTLDSLDNYHGKIFYIIEELEENGELFNYVYETKQGFSERIACKIFTQILKYVKILHDNRIAHCDIKPENIIVGKQFKLKLIDFGFSEILGKDDNFIYDYKGSEIYSSPEVRNRNMNGYDGIKNDIFSLGVLLFVITIGRFPFEKSNYSDRHYRLIMGKKYEDFWCYYEEYNLTDEFKDLINNLLSYDPSERFSIDEIFQHLWIKMFLNENNDNNKNDNHFINDIDDEVVDELKKRKEIIDAKNDFF